MSTTPIKDLYTTDVNTKQDYKDDWAETTKQDWKIDFQLTTVVAPVAAFTADVLAGVGMTRVNFSDGSLNYPTSWAWDFGDGCTSQLQNPTHWYQVPGSYTVVLTAKNSAGQNVGTRANYIVIS